MSRLFYCPKCGDKNIDGYRLMRGQFVGHTRGGWGRPISFYRCEKCGNVLAGSMDVTDWDERGIDYASSIIRGYNEGGTYYYKPFHDYCLEHLGSEEKK